MAPVRLMWQVRVVMAVTLIATNVVGTVVVYTLATLVVPLPEVPDETALRLENLVLAAIYLPVAVLYGVVRGWFIVRRLGPWLREGRDPDPRERAALLRLPGRMFGLQATLWGVAAVLFGLFNARESVVLGVVVAGVVALSGLSTCAVAFLLTERVLRPLARRALASGVPQRLGIRTVAVRSMFAWLLGTGVSVLGIVLAGLTALAFVDDVTTLQLQVTMVVLGGTAFVVGGLTAWLAAKASSDPIRALRRAVARVSEGDLDTEVQIYDGTELGILQAGFNEMVHGLRERETIRDLFGRHVGDDVARAALQGGVRLGGEVRRVGVLFVDIIGSTTLATERPPEEVVGLLNRFFDVVIDVVHEYDGWINKFEGDAALAVWGAPVAVDGMEPAVLAGARVLGERLATEVPEVEAGIGVSAGAAVAGNVGAAERYEYTVIGDPVNEAARLTELAKSVPGRVVAHADLLEHAGTEAERWERLEPVVVRGRSEPTPVAAPRR
jgi:adenylate cyclase